MFWRVAGFSQPSPLENILDKDDFTLEEVGRPGAPGAAPGARGCRAASEGGPVDAQSSMLTLSRPPRDALRAPAPARGAASSAAPRPARGRAGRGRPGADGPA